MHDQRNPARGAGGPRPDRRPDRGSRAAGGSRRSRPAYLGDRDVRRVAARRAQSPAGRADRPRRQRDPVERGWDDKEGEIETKGRKRRRVPVPGVLREHLLSHLMRSGRRDDQLVFGATERTPFDPRRLTARADAAWEAAGLDRIILHECRHTFASLMIAAGVNAKALSTYIGHEDIATTLNKYGHLMPGNEEQAAGLLDAYLDAAKGGSS